MTRARAHWFQHVPFEGLGSIEPWLRAAGYEITKTPFFDTPRLPDLNDVDLLVVMGGPMSVNDETAFPWLRQEKQFILHAIQADKRVLGVCLGAQLIASAMDASVHRNRVKEIGWFPVQCVRPIGVATFSFPPEVEVFHWHGETFDVPSGAVRLARTDGCENQAFQLGRTVVALQFHLETTPESVRAMISHGRAELSPSRYVQPEATILSAAPEKYRIVNDLMGGVLSFLTSGDGAR